LEENLLNVIKDNEAEPLPVEVTVENS